MAGTRLRFVAVALLMIVAWGPPAAASDLSQACTGSGGMFTADDCTCLDGKVAPGDDRVDLTAFFQASAAEVKGGPKPDENNLQLKRGFAALNKYLGQCLK